MTEAAKYLMKQVQIELAMGQIRAITNSAIPQDEKNIRIQRVTDELGNWIEENEKVTQTD